MKDARYLRMTTATALIAAVLAGAVISAAAWRSRGRPSGALPASGTQPPLAEGAGGQAAVREGPDVWEEECSACHRPNRKGSLEELRAWARGRPRGVVVDFLLQGPNDHPTYDALPDEELARVLQVLGDEAATAGEVRARR